MQLAPAQVLVDLSKGNRRYIPIVRIPQIYRFVFIYPAARVSFVTVVSNVLLERFLSSNPENFAGSLVSCLIKQGHYIGEVGGLALGMPVAAVQEKITADLNHAIATSSPAYSDALHRAGAFILLHPTINPTPLLALICTPTDFSIHSVESSVSVWSWVMSGNPKLGLSILSRLIRVWEVSALRRVGLYAPHTPSTPFSSKLTYAPSLVPSNERHACAAHMVWLEFLHERLLVLENSDKGVIDLLLQLVCVWHMHMSKIGFFCAKTG